MPLKLSSFCDKQVLSEVIDTNDRKLSVIKASLALRWSLPSRLVGATLKWRSYVGLSASTGQSPPLMTGCVKWHSPGYQAALYVPDEEIKFVRMHTVAHKSAVLLGGILDAIVMILGRSRR